MEEIKIGEVWKDIPNYEGYYQISNLGRIKSVARKVKYQNSYTKNVLHVGKNLNQREKMQSIVYIVQNI